MKKVILIVIALVFVGGVVWTFIEQKGAKYTSPPSISDVEEPENTTSPEALSATPGSGTVTPTAPAESLKRTISEISLTVSSPQPNTTVTSSRLTVTGKTSPKAEVYVNEAELFSDAKGNFTATITLDEGENPVVVTAVDENGNMAEKDFVVTYSTGQ